MNSKSFKLLSLVCVGVLALTGCQNGDQKTPSPSTGEKNTAAVQPSVTPSMGTKKSSETSAGSSPETSSERSTAPVKAGTALTALKQLPVKGSAPMTGYSREKFPHWKDIDNDGCRSSDQAVKLHANVELKNKCREVAGVMTDPYSGQEIRWGSSRVKIVDIDHVVALGNAWVSGAWQMTQDVRQNIANDQLNLLPVRADLNRQKGDSNAASWLPPNKSFRCQYVSRQIAVKKKYGLSITSAEATAMGDVLNTCPNEKLPTS